MQIEVVQYDPYWIEQYEQEKEKILSAVSRWVVSLDHVGSTSIPGLSAKPTIDMCMGIEDLQLANDHIIPALEKFNYDYLPQLEEAIPDRRYIQKLDADGKHLFHIHIVHKNSQRKKDYLSFKNYLINHPLELQKYAELKLKLAEKYKHNREAYTESKADFIKKIIYKYNKLNEGIEHG